MSNSSKSSQSEVEVQVNQLVGSASGVNELSAVQAGDDLDATIEAEIEKIVRANAVARKPTVTRQVVKMPGQAGKVKTVVRRLATPVPDIIERVVVIEPAQDIVNVVIERPTTPPPQVQEKKVVEKKMKPVVSHQIVRVQSRSAAKSVSRREYAPSVEYTQAAPAAPAPAQLQYQQYQTADYSQYAAPAQQYAAPAQQYAQTSYGAQYSGATSSYGGYGAAQSYGGFNAQGSAYGNYF